MSQWRTAVFLSFLLQMCSAVSILECKPTRNGNGMVYNIFNLPDPKCVYLWDNGKVLLATNDNKTALVIRHNSSSLETSECLPDVTWTQQCPQIRDSSANCSTTCANKDSLHEDSKRTEEQSNTWIVIVIGVLIGLTIFGLTIFLLYKYIKDCIPRIRHCSVIEGAYRAVRRENNEPGTCNV